MAINGTSNGAAASGRLAGKIAVITGGGMGIGETTARRFAKEGASILIADFNVEAGEGVVKSLVSEGVKAEFVKADVTSRADWDNIVKVAKDVFGRIDILVNNAGTAYVAESSLTVSEKNFDKVFSVNVRSIFHSVQTVFPVMIEQHAGSVINISSIAALRPRGKLTWYNSSKAAVSNASKALAHEFGPDGIRVNSVCPVLVPTQLANNFVPTFENTPEGRAEAAKLFQIPLGRLTTMDDVASACLWLASEDSSFITGTDTSVDGGRSI
jgi:3-oxoacyl-[acyl-carrier protein] reductase